MLKALAQQEKQATRLRQREANAGPRNDLDIEWEDLLAAQQQQQPPLRYNVVSNVVLSHAGQKE